MLKIIFTGNVTVKAMMKCEKFERDGEEFLNITRFAIKMEPKSASIYLGNLFGGDEALG
jgi:Haemolymph juvenile hormone binding protein (JHBP)